MTISLNSEAKHASYYVLSNGEYYKGSTNTVDAIIDALSQEWLNCWAHGKDEAVRNYGRDLFVILRDVFNTTPTCVDGDDPLIKQCQDELDAIIKTFENN